MKKQSTPEIEISLEDVALIMGDSYSFFPRILKNCFCGKCENHITTIVMYRIYLDPLQDIVLKGNCASCGHQVGRHIETGENKESVGVATHIRGIIKNYRKHGPGK